MQYKKKHTYILKEFFIVILDGSVENVHYDEIIARIKQLCYGLDSENIDPVCTFFLL